MARPARPWFRSERGEWYMTIDGKKVALGVTDPANEAAAWAAVQAFLASKRGDSLSNRPVCELVPRFLEAITYRVEPETVRKYRADLAWLVALYPNGAVSSLVPDDIERRAAQEPWSDSHRANVLYTVQSFVRWAGVPSFRLRRPAKESRGAGSVIPVEVYDRILRETTGDFHQYIRVLWATGARPSEVMGLTVDAIDWPNGSATLKRHKTKKKGKVRTLHFSPEALKVLAEQRTKHGGGWLFRSATGERLTLRAVVGRFLRLSEKIGHPVSSYCFRHTYATRALVAGVADAQVAALLGQTSTNMLSRHYNHISANGRMLKDLAAKLDGAA
jgi:integrase